MRVCGIIAEYDPFHKGHLFQLSEAKKRSEADYMVCVISTAREFDTSKVEKVV